MKIPVFRETPPRRAKLKATDARSDGKPMSCREIVLASIKAKPGTSSEVAARTGLAVTTCWRWVSRQHDMGLVHVTQWTRFGRGGAYVPTFTYGPGEDAPKPEGRNHRPEDEMTLRIKRAVRQENLELAQEKALEDAIKRKRREALKRPAVRDPLVAALFGPVQKMEAA